MTAEPERPVLVGVDGTARSIQAARWAAAEAVRHHSRLLIAHATYLPYLETTDVTEPSAADSKYADAAVEEAYRAATEAEPGLDVQIAVHAEKPAHYLLKQSGSALMIVLGTHSGNSLTGALFSSLSQTVAAHAMCPVVLVGGADNAEPSTHGPVVVGVSPSPGGREALRFAFREAQLRGAELLAVRSWGDVDWGTGRLGYGSELFAELRRIEGEVLRSCLAEIREDFPTVTVHHELRGKRAPLALQQAAAGAQLLVVGAHRQDDHWFSRLGSVPSWLLHRSPCPLAIVGQPHALPAELPEAESERKPVTA